MGVYQQSDAQNSKIDSLEHLLSLNPEVSNQAVIFYKMGIVMLDDKQYVKGAYYLDKSLSLAQKAKLDTLYFFIYSRLGLCYENIDKKGYKDKAINYYRLSYYYLDTSRYKITYSKALNNIGKVYIKKNNLDSAQFYIEKSIEIKKELLKESPDSAKTYHSIGMSIINLGSLYINRSDYSSAIKKYSEALVYLSKSTDTNTIASTYLNIGVIYFYTQDSLSALDSYKKAFEYASKVKNLQVISSAFLNMGVIQMGYKKWELADSLLNEALKIRLDIGPDRVVAGIYENLGIISKRTNNIDKALEYYYKSLELKSIENNPASMGKLYANLGQLYVDKKSYSLAEETLIKALEYSKQALDPETQLQVNWSLSELYEKTGKFEKSLIYFKRYKAVDDSIHSIDTDKIINELKEKYAASEKDRTISDYKQKQKLAILTQEKQRLNNQLLFGLAVIIVIISVFIIVLINNKRKNEKSIFEKNSELSKQKMLELIKEQEMHSVNSFISGQEKERARIASDLHDRLGSLLSTVKLHFNALDHYFEEKTDPEFMEGYNFAMNLLDQSVSEVRAVSHNLSREILTEFGLVGAIENLKDAINSAGSLKLIFINTGFNMRLTYEYEIEIYRIVQELVTNVIKHANAGECIIQFIANDDWLSITVEDDGVGFDINKVNKNGMGLHNIFKRTAKVQGKYSIDSSPGKGATFFFEIPLEAINPKNQRK